MFRGLSSLVRQQLPLAYRTLRVDSYITGSLPWLTVTRTYKTQGVFGTTQTGDTQPRPDAAWDIFDRWTSAASPSGMRGSPEELWEKNSRLASDALARNPIPDAYTGRRVKVLGGNVADAFRRLDQILARNSVRYELKLTERHEKKGAKRRRLKSERWRNRFANEVRKKVALVKAIRRRGA